VPAIWNGLKTSWHFKRVEIKTHGIKNQQVFK